MTTQPVFKPREYRCFDCETNIKSRYSGEFVSCKCGKCFVDQTTHYIRVGGHPTYIGDMNEP